MHQMTGNHRRPGRILAGPITLDPYRMLDELTAALTDSSTGREAGRFDIDVTQDADGYTIVADLPGIMPDTVSIRFEDGRLTIETAGDEKAAEEKDTAAAEARGRTIVRERRNAAGARRTVQVGHKVDSDLITAHMKDGVLTVRAPYSDRARGRDITIEA